jgi:hypothetical protein
MSGVKTTAAADGGQAAAAKEAPIAGTKMLIRTWWDYAGDGTWCTKESLCADRNCLGGVVAVYGSGRWRVRGRRVEMCLREGEMLVVGSVFRKHPYATYLATLTLYLAGSDGVYFVHWIVDDGMSKEDMLAEVIHGFKWLKYWGLCNRAELSKWLDAARDLLADYKTLKEWLERECQPEGVA